MEGLSTFVGSGQLIIAAGLAGVLVLSLALLLREVSSRDPEPRQMRLLGSRALLCAVLAVLFLNQWLSAGRAVAAAGLLPPGSCLTRGLVFGAEPWLRRLLEPWMLMLLAAVCLFRQTAGVRAAVILCSAAALILALGCGAEAAFLIPAIAGKSAEILGAGGCACLHFAWAALFLLLLAAAQTFELLGRRKSVNTAGCFLPGAVLILFCGCAGLLFLVNRVEAGRRPLLLGAHYYSWFPENWAAGYTGRETEPPVLPALGQYHSGDKAVFEQHLKWARQAGIDYFVFDWWAQRSAVDRRLKKNLPLLSSVPGFSFCLMYESLDLKRRWEPPVAGEPSNVVLMTPRRAEHLKRHWAFLAKTYMGHPSYLRIAGKPVLFVYATRHLVGPVREAVEEARREVRRLTGLEMFLVADEAFFNVVSYNEDRLFFLKAEGDPEWRRITAFDALTAYNPYDSARVQHGGEKGVPVFLDDVAKLYSRYRAVAAAAGLHFFPGFLAAYNDRGLRPDEDHFTIPRFPGDGQETFLAMSMRSWSRFAGSSLPCAAITSWNEWNEGTQIEPAAPSPPTRKDRSPEGSFYTQGELLSGYAEAYLSGLRKPLETLTKIPR